MNHLSEEQLVLHHYHDDDAPGAAEQHLASCPTCRAEYARLRRVLAMVDQMPIPERGAEYGEQIWKRLHWKLRGRRPRTRWTTILAAAAVLAVAFFAGQLWRARTAATQPAGQQVAAAPAANAQTRGETAADRVLVVVVSDHLENSERMLLEVANADTRRGLDLSDDSKRAAELVASNRIYRQTASRRGDARIASLLADLEPILLELSHAEKLSPEELKSLQKRIDSKGLLFKVRLVSAEAGGGEPTPAPQKGMNSL